MKEDKRTSANTGSLVRESNGGFQQPGSSTSVAIPHVIIHHLTVLAVIGAFQSSCEPNAFNDSVCKLFSIEKMCTSLPNDQQLRGGSP